MQGNLAQEQPIIYNVNNDGMNLWFEDLKQTYQLPEDSSLLHSSLTTILQRYSDDIQNGYILCDDSTLSTNVALSLCGIFDKTIVITSDLISIMNSLQIPEKMDVRGKDSRWLWKHFKVS